MRWPFGKRHETQKQTHDQAKAREQQQEQAQEQEQGHPAKAPPSQDAPAPEATSFAASPLKEVHSSEEIGFPEEDRSPEGAHPPEASSSSLEASPAPETSSLEASPAPEASSLEASPAPEASPPKPETQKPEAPKPADKAPKALGWFGQLRQGLRKSSNQISGGLASIFTQRKLDDETLEELEELLITADLGVAVASQVTANLAKTRFGKNISEQEIKAALADEISAILAPVAHPLNIPTSPKPHVIFFVGVNGSGKTTTIGKIADAQGKTGKSLMLAAGDTFRAAAVEQLKIWGTRTNAPVIAKTEGADPASLAYEALQTATAQGTDLLLIDTAGRLHNRQELMEELAKMVRVVKKLDDSAPHQVILVLDATIGQNAIAQVKAFAQMVQITGLIVTKLDGTAKGGVVVALAKEFGLPVHGVGVGEGADHMQPFDPQDFAHALVGYRPSNSP